MTETKPLPLAGVRVMDLGQFIAMPFCTLWLAWLGADVLVIESRKRSTARTAPPFAAGHESDPNASGYFNLLNGTKKSCTVDLTMSEGRKLVLQIAGKMDVIVDNFSTGVMEKLGLTYEAVSAINPSVIMASNGAFGRSGPMRNARGLHSAVNLFSGVADVTGYEGSHPRILGGVIPDPLSGAYSAFAILAALNHRQKTGEGQFIDLAMYEAMMTLIPEAIIDFTLNGIQPERVGNRDRAKAPHGIYPCHAPDTWIAISVETEAEWQAFSQATGLASLAADLRFRTMTDRLTHVVELDAAVEAWARAQDMHAAVEMLQRAGVTAGPVLRVDELLENEQLNERGLVISTDHPVAGTRRQLGIPWRMDSLGIDYRRAPLVGEHTRETLSSLLGMSDTEVSRLEAAGVLN